MRPLPTGKTHGVIHSVKVDQGNLDELAERLKIPPSEKRRLRPGDEIHFVREAKQEEINPSKK